MAIVIDSSSDTPEQISEAMEGTVEEAKKEAPPAKEAKEEKEPKEAKEEPAEEPEEEESEPEEEEEPKEEKPKGKGLPAGIRDRLREVTRAKNSERDRRIAAERRVAELEAAPAPRKEEPKRPQTYCGRPKPTIDQFTADPTAHPDPYASHAEAMGEWFADEKLAKRDFDRANQEAEQDKRAAKTQFEKAQSAAMDRHDDYDEVLTSSDVQITELMKEAIDLSPIGPEILYFLAGNEEEAAKIRKLKPIQQATAIGKLESRIEAELASTEETLKESKPDKGVPAKAADKTKSKAPLPPNRLKPAGPGPKTLTEMAGTDARSGVDINFSRDYEKSRMEQSRK